MSEFCAAITLGTCPRGTPAVREGLCADCWEFYVDLREVGWSCSGGVSVVESVVESSEEGVAERHGLPHQGMADALDAERVVGSETEMAELAQVLKHGPSGRVNNRDKETCPEGHTYDSVDGRGRRVCSICRAYLDRLRYLARRERKMGG